MSSQHQPIEYLAPLRLSITKENINFYAFDSEAFSSTIDIKHNQSPRENLRNSYQYFRSINNLFRDIEINTHLFHKIDKTLSKESKQHIVNSIKPLNTYMDDTCKTIKTTPPDLTKLEKDKNLSRNLTFGLGIACFVPALFSWFNSYIHIEKWKLYGPLVGITAIFGYQALKHYNNFQQHNKQLNKRNLEVENDRQFITKTCKKLESNIQEFCATFNIDYKSLKPTPV